MPDTLTRPILDGDHATMTDKQLRGHYAKGCRHDDCRAASTAYKSLDASGKEDAKANPDRRSIPVSGDTGQPAPDSPSTSSTNGIVWSTAALKLQALHALGYDEAQLSELLPLVEEEIRDIVLDPAATVSAPVAVAIGRTFKNLDGKPPKATTREARERLQENLAWAKKNGWTATLAAGPVLAHTAPLEEPTQPSSGEPAVTTSEAITEPRRDGVPRKGSEPAASVDPHVAPLEATPAAAVQLATISAEELAYQPEPDEAPVIDEDPAPEPAVDERDALIRIVEAENENLRGEVSMLTIALEVRGEIIVDLHATNIRLKDAIASKELTAAAARLELLATCHEIQQLTALTFHLADQCPDTTAPKPSLWRAIRELVGGAR